MTTEELTVAFLGLGNMGGPMAGNLVDAGYTVHGFDPVPAALDAAASRGVRTAGSMAEAVREADVVLTMLPSGKHLLDALQGDEGLLAVAGEGTLFLDCSTIDVVESRRAAELVEEAGFVPVDAPVSGGVVGAEGGTLTFMVGGTPEGVERVRPLLEVMGAKIVHCGEAGAGQAAKVCNNMLLGVSMLGAVEAFVLGEKLGLDHQALFDVISTSSGQCWSVTTNCPVPGPVPTSPANRDYTPGFASQLMLKDLTLAVQALQAAGVPGEMGSLAQELYRAWVVDEDGNGKDFSGIIERLRERAS